jgi:hypothetical protein
MTSPYYKSNITLPKDVVTAFNKIDDDVIKRNEYIKALRKNSWSLQAIADAAGGLTRERVRQIINNDYENADKSRASIAGLPMPLPPLKPVKAPRVVVNPSAKTLARLLELQPSAQKVRSHSPKFRKQAEEYTSLINYALTVEKVNLSNLARHLGVTHGSLRFRLARYGYLKNHNSDSTCYKPILKKNRYVLQS